MATGTQFVTLIPIKKMDRAIAFYTKHLGAKVTARGEGAMKNYWASAKVGGAEIWFVTPGKGDKRTLAYHALLVKDIKKHVAKLTKGGVKFDKATAMSKETRIEGPIAHDAFGSSAFFKDSEGNLLMLWHDNMSM